MMNDSKILLALVAFMLMVDSALHARQSNEADSSSVTIELQTEDEATSTLKSFRKLDDHPLFEMRFEGNYVADKPLATNVLQNSSTSGWACSIFVSYGKDGQAVYGRNFDWYHNPALLLHTNPADGYASISMVDISYLGFKKGDKKFETVEGRRALLGAPMLPFDGMNEHGLTVGMAAVQNTEVPDDPEKPDVGSLQIIRIILDRAKNTEEALEIFDQFDIRSKGGPRIHYLIADALGESAVIELKDGEKHVHQDAGKTWQSATNFYLTGQKKPLQQCWRFKKIDQTMSRLGALSTDQAFDLLKGVAQKNTVWSNVYDMKNKSVEICTSQNFGKRHSAKIELTASGEGRQE